MPVKRTVHCPFAQAGEGMPGGGRQAGIGQDDSGTCEQDLCSRASAAVESARGEH
jgi:hypothetical protein